MNNFQMGHCEDCLMYKREKMEIKLDYYVASFSGGEEERGDSSVRK